MICQIVPKPCFRTDLRVDRTRNRMRVAIESGKGMKVKVLKFISTASGALVAGGVRDRWIPSNPIQSGDSFPVK